MYESPITKMMNEMTESLVEQRENAIIQKITETVGFDIDKQELIKALNYDRQQYEKGFADAMSAIRNKMMDIKTQGVFDYISIQAVIEIIDNYGRISGKEKDADSN